MTDHPDVDRRLVQLERTLEHQMNIIGYKASALERLTCRVLATRLSCRERGLLWWKPRCRNSTSTPRPRSS